MDAKIRKLRNKLICSGYAVIAFGVWSIVRIILLRLTGAPTLHDMLGQEQGPAVERFLYILLTAVLSMDLLFRIYVGRSAIREGQGERHGLFYLILTFLYTAVSLWSDLSYLSGAFHGGADSAMIAANIVDITTCIAMGEIIVSSLYLRILEKEQRAK